jgi:FAD/FMN-containing dehydrogenase/Fe-S oxidoreductase
MSPAGPLAALEQALRKELRGDVFFDAASRGRYATDASIYQIMPLGVVCPRDDADLQLTLDLARQQHIPVLARGAGSSQCGQTVGQALIVDVSRHLNRILDIDLERRLVTVEPGVVLDQLNLALRPHGLVFPVDVSTSAQATIGGMAGNNSCGSRSLLYGNMVHNVESIEAFLGDGASALFGPGEQRDPRARAIESSFRSLAHKHRHDIIERVPKMLRRVGGYNIDLLDPQSPKPYRDDGLLNMAQLLVGSEGTLAFSRRLTLRLSPLPQKRVLGVVNFRSLDEAMSSTAAIVALQPSAVELVDRTMIELALGNPAFAFVIGRVLRHDPGALLLVEFASSAAADAPLAEKLDELGDLLAARFSDERLVRLESDAEQKALWEVRKAGLNIMMSMKGDGKPVSFIEDCAVPLEHLADYTARLSEVFARHNTVGTWYAHASVGTLHVRPILDMRRDGANKMRAIAEEAATLVRAFKGAYSGEHGDGLCRGEWIGWQFGPALSSAFRDIKALFDPSGSYAPGKMLDATPMDQASTFRYPPGYRALHYVPQLDWSSFDVTRDPVSGVEGRRGSGGDPSHGLAMAVEMCNNNGHCRKFDAGTMCPSYRVTRDETHVTRGRANTLRLALSGQLGQHGLASAEVREVLDLCVSCKGCRRECPTGVDMARIKIEARAAHQTRYGLRLRDRLIAALPRALPLVTRYQSVAYTLNRLASAAPWLQRAVGFTDQRALPELHRSYLAGRHQTSVDDPEVVLWVDTFNNHFEPHIVEAAVAVLAAAGVATSIASSGAARPLCCGRTYLAAGRIEQARREAQRSLAVLYPLVKNGALVVGLEPSCLLTLKDEWLSLGLGANAELVARSAMLFEEFLARPDISERLGARLRAMPERVLVHGHCHQKAFDAFDPIIKVLRLIPELEVTPIDSSCCGMAGSFGLEAEHYTASMAMAELALAPAIRRNQAQRIVADGTSCRAQVLHTTSRHALHCAELMLEALAPA